MRPIFLLALLLAMALTQECPVFTCGELPPVEGKNQTCADKVTTETGEMAIIFVSSKKIVSNTDKICSLISTIVGLINVDFIFFFFFRGDVLPFGSNGLGKIIEIYLTYIESSIDTRKQATNPNK